MWGPQSVSQPGELVANTYISSDFNILKSLDSGLFLENSDLGLLGFYTEMAKTRLDWAMAGSFSLGWSCPLSGMFQTQPFGLVCDAWCKDGKKLVLPFIFVSYQGLFSGPCIPNKAAPFIE